MADKIPLKLIDAGSGVGTLAEMASGDTVPLSNLTNALLLVLAGLVAGTNTPITATDTVLSAFENLQAQVTAKAVKGANSDITSLSGLTTALSVAQGGTGQTSIAALLTSLETAGAYGKTNVLGTVSQTSGIPTGALMEYGSNSNGEFWKFASGLMICTAVATFTTSVSNALNGGFYSGAAAPVKNMPATFISLPRVSKEVTTSTSPNDSTGYASISGPPTTSTWNGFYFGELFGRPSQTYILNYMAIGRWF